MINYILFGMWALICCLAIGKSDAEGVGQWMVVLWTAFTSLVGAAYIVGLLP